MAAAAAAAGAVVPISRCTDNIACRPNTIVCPFPRINCTGLPAPFVTPAASNGQPHGPAHPLAAPVDTCGDCQTVARFFFISRINKIADQSAYSGYMGQLCQRCITEEVELYWMRTQNPRPFGPGTAQSLGFIERWPLPNAAGGPGHQNLCTCMHHAVDRFQAKCWQCSYVGFLDNAENPYMQTEDILRNHTKDVIKGRVQCQLVGPPGNNFPTGRILPHVVNNRMAANIGRLCPCGERPKAPEPPGQEYITVCLACRGVFVDPNNLPPAHSFANHARSPNHRTARINAAALQQMGVFLTDTRGPVRARRKWDWRVNIEAAWLPGGDPVINGA